MDEEKRNDIPVRISTILHILSISLIFVLIQSHSLHAIYPIFLFPLILEEGKPSSDRIVHARADQSHLLRRSVTEHVTSVHLVRVPIASRCQPRRSGTGRDACPLPPLPFLSSLYPNETKRSDRTGRDASTFFSHPISRFHETASAHNIDALHYPFFSFAFSRHFFRSDSIPSRATKKFVSMKFEEFGMGKRDDEGGEPRKYDRGG